MYKYRHFQDPRSQHQIFLSNELIRSLTDQNLRRLSQRRVQTTQHPQIKEYFKDYLFVCIHGVPAFPNQYDYLQLPGSVLQITFSTFQLGISESERAERAKVSDLLTQATIIHHKIEAVSQTKAIVFVFHSFGTFLMSVYVHHYDKGRVKGLVDIGGTPITFYPFLKQLVMAVQSTPLEWMQQNADIISSLLNEELKKFNMSPYNSKYMTQGLLISIKSQAMETLFQLNRQWPDVLKCIIFGRNDQIITEKALNQKAVYYCYKRKIKDVQPLLKNYQEIFAERGDDLQTKFVFNLKGEKHSLHTRSRNHKVIKDIVWSYLGVLAGAKR